MKLIITGQYGHLSRGYTTARYKSTGAWATRYSGGAIITEPGIWHLSTTDGFSRRKGCDVTVQDDGSITDLSPAFEATLESDA